MKQNKTVLTLGAVRDFFMARNAAELAKAYQYLALANPATAPAVADWQGVEFAFNRLFVGPRALLAPPFASVYLEAEPQLMGRSTLNVRYLYQMMGLTSPWQNSIPDDHLSLELDAYRQLHLAAGQVASAELIALRQYFLRGHLNRWLPKFISRVKEIPETPPAIIFVVDGLADWLKRELAEWPVAEAATHYA